MIVRWAAMRRVRIQTILIVIAAIALPLSRYAAKWKADRGCFVGLVHMDIPFGPSAPREYFEYGPGALPDLSDGDFLSEEKDLMSVNMTELLVSLDEISASRRFRLSDDQLRRAIDTGILEDGARADDRISLDQYHQLVEVGILTKHDRVELLGGRLVAKMSIKPPHQTAMRKARELLDRLVPDGWLIDQNAPIAMIRSDSEPEPDLMVIRGGFQDYAEHHPGPGDMGLVVEVAHSSLAEDWGYQKRLYAFEAIPVYWIINLVDLQIEVYLEPSGPTTAPDYRVRNVFRDGDHLPLQLDDRVVGMIAARDLLP